MVWFHTFWVQTDVKYFAFQNGPSSTLFTSAIFWFTFHNHMNKVSSFILVPAIREVLRDCVGRFLPYFSRVSSTSSRKNFNNGILFPWILRNNLRAVTTVVFIDRAKKGHHPFLEQIRTRQFDTNWSNKSTRPIFALYFLKRFGIGTINRWYNENSAKIELDFTFCFWEKESLMVLCILRTFQDWYMCFFLT